jgi:hypothetical protein
MIQDGAFLVSCTSIAYILSDMSSIRDHSRRTRWTARGKGMLLLKYLLCLYRGKRKYCMDLDAIGYGKIYVSVKRRIGNTSGRSFFSAESIFLIYRWQLLVDMVSQEARFDSCFTNGTLESIVDIKNYIYSIYMVRMYICMYVRTYFIVLKCISVVENKDQCRKIIYLHLNEIIHRKRYPYNYNLI